MEDQGQTRRRCLEVLPQSIEEAHERLFRVIEKICMLEDFLIGSQVRDHKPEGEGKEEKQVGIVDRCFSNLNEVNGIIGECLEQLQNIIIQLGIPNGPEQER